MYQGLDPVIGVSNGLLCHLRFAQHDVSRAPRVHDAEFGFRRDIQCGPKRSNGTLRAIEGDKHSTIRPAALSPDHQDGSIAKTDHAFCGGAREQVRLWSPGRLSQDDQIRATCHGLADDDAKGISGKDNHLDVLEAGCESTGHALRRVVRIIA